MEYRVLGKTGLKVSRLGFGGIPIQRIDAEGTKALMHRLLEAGVNYIDSARGYTVSEEYIGYGLEGIRDKFILATKGRGLTKQAMQKDLETSLHNFRTDYIDLYQFHNPSLEDLEVITAPGGALEALQDAKAAGTVRHIGLTAHSTQVFEKALDMDWVETIMFPYNLVENQGAELIAKCQEKNIGFICMKPLAGGAIDDASLALRYIVQNRRHRGHPRHGKRAGALPESGRRRQFRPADRGRNGENPGHPGFPGHPVLPPLQLLRPLHRGHSHPPAVRAGGLSDPLRPGRLGQGPV